MSDNRIYVAIDLKSFYASVECKQRGLDPMRTNLVVADLSRTAKTICLAVTPSLKAYGIPGRARLFEVIKRVEEVNLKRRSLAKGRELKGESYDSVELDNNPELALSYITAPPRMALYMEYSTQIYSIYLKYFSAEDIHVYSIDEVFIDMTGYLGIYKISPRELVKKIIQDVFKNTGITATAGIGTNLYLAKVAMDIMAKHIEADSDGVRIAELDELSYRRQLWCHKPITDFWRVGKGYAKRLKDIGLYTMGDVALCSIGGKSEFHNERLLYKNFGVNAELLIDHAWGWEPCTIADIKAYRPESSSISTGQVLHCPYDYEKARLVTWEMTDLLVLDLVKKGLACDQLILTIGYDIENLIDEERRKNYKGEVTIDRYGRRVPKHAHSTVNLKTPSSSAKVILEAVMELYDRIIDKNLLVRRITIAANHLICESELSNGNKEGGYKQLDLFTDYAQEQREQKKENERIEKERKIQRAVIDIKRKFGKNAIIKGKNLEEGATAMQRNSQIGGHKA